MATKTQKTVPTTVSVDSFLSAIADEAVRKDSTEIVEMMRQASGQEPVMWGSAIIGFGRYHYKYESGHEGDSCIIGFSPRKQNLTMYVGASLPEIQPLLAKLGKHTTGKGCLYIKRLKDVNRNVLNDLIVTSYNTLKNK